MKIVLDEQLDPRSAAVLNVIEDRHGCTFVSLRDLAPPNTQDIEIPNVCKRNDAVALVTADVKDFGAKTVYFEALLAAGGLRDNAEAAKESLRPGSSNSTALELVPGSSERLARCVISRPDQGEQQRHFYEKPRRASGASLFERDALRAQRIL